VVARAQRTICLRLGVGLSARTANSKKHYKAPENVQKTTQFSLALSFFCSPSHFISMHAKASFKTTIIAALVGSAYAQSSGDLVTQLRNAPTAPQRLALLKDSDVCVSSSIK
jgi:hypothetical protein